MFEWRRNGVSIGSTAEVNVTITSASSGGDYECIVSNRAGNDSIFTVVNGEWKKKFIVLPNSVYKVIATIKLLLVYR